MCDARRHGMTPVAAAFAAYCGFGFGFSVALVHLVRPLESISNGMYFIKFNFISYNAAHCAALCLRVTSED
jgi:hypothetical protein